MINQMADSYHKLLTSIDWDDELLVSGLKEGLSKFLSNAYLNIAGGISKHQKTHYISKLALEQLKNGDHANLVFEHMVPKSKYVQEPCEQMAKLKSLSKDYIVNLLDKYWKLATITELEHGKLRRTSMPENWDGEDIFARYSDKGIVLIPNPYFSG